MKIEYYKQHYDFFNVVPFYKWIGISAYFFYEVEDKDNRKYFCLSFNFLNHCIDITFKTWKKS